MGRIGCTCREPDQMNTMFVYLQLCSFSDVRGRYYCPFNQGTGPLRKVTEYKGQQRLGLFLIELKRHTNKVLKDNHTTTIDHQQGTNKTFFSSITPLATSQSRTTQVGLNQDTQKGLQLQYAVQVNHDHQDHGLVLVIKNKDHYHIASKGLPSIRRPLHVEVAHV